MRGIKVHLTIEDIAWLFDRQRGRCALTGQKIVFASGNRTSKGGRVPGCASLDRLDAKKPYEMGNVQWIHTSVNFAKHKLNQRDFIKLCKGVVEHTNGRIPRGRRRRKISSDVKS